MRPSRCRSTICSGCSTRPSEIEFLLLGTGIDMRPIPADLKAALKAAGISSDSMNTGAAVRTFNIMLLESRAVAAALIAV
jgi:uncharacterized protein